LFEQKASSYRLASNASSDPAGANSMTPNVKKPRTLSNPWPPTDHLLKAQTVTGWDDWWSLQRLFKRCDAWDIIYYNFATYDPEEVNWYLRERIGCRDASRDGKNYRFGVLPGGRPMQVYIPTDDWLPPGPKQAAAKRAALNVLRDHVASTMAFRAGPLELKASDLAAVANAIESGHITIIHRPCMGHMAEYRGKTNQLLVPFSGMPPLNMRALMVHEAVHAAMDVRRTRQTMQQAEGLSYIAQALYLRRNGVSMGTSVPQPAFAVNPRNFLAWTGIFRFAASIAEAVDTGAPVNNLDLMGLGISISAAPTYAHEGAPPNDGV
jgi:hypothetical protein